MLYVVYKNCVRESKVIGIFKDKSKAENLKRKMEFNKPQFTWFTISEVETDII